MVDIKTREAGEQGSKCGKKVDRGGFPSGTHVPNISQAK